MNTIEKLEAVLSQPWRYRCPECLTVGIESWSCCASCASERPPRRVDLRDELLAQAAPDLLKAVRLAHQTDIGCYRAVPVLSVNRIDQEWEDCGECPSCLLRVALKPLFREEGQG